MAIAKIRLYCILKGTPASVGFEKLQIQECKFVETTFLTIGFPCPHCVLVTFWNTSVFKVYRSDNLRKLNDFTAHKLKLSIKDFFCECAQIRSFLRIWSYFLIKIFNAKRHFLCSAFYHRLPSDVCPIPYHETMIIYLFQSCFKFL